jgi:hypothetical protein
VSQLQNRLSRRKAGSAVLGFGLMGGFGLLGLLAACAPALDTSRPVFGFARSWQGAAAGAPRLMNNLAWWQEFRDPTLSALIARALTSNPDLAAAQARARAAGQLAGTIAGPVNVTGGLAARGKSGKLDSADTSQSADLGIEILFDPGRGREASRSLAAASAGEAAAQAAGARLFVLSEISTAYLTLRYDQRRLALAQMPRVSARPSPSPASWKRAAKPPGSTRCAVRRALPASRRKGPLWKGLWPAIRPSWRFWPAMLRVPCRRIWLRRWGKTPASRARAWRRIRAFPPI